MGHYLNHDTSQICTLSLASCLGSKSTFPSPTTGYRRTSHVQVQTGIYNFNSLNSNHSGFTLVVDGSPSVHSYKLEAWDSSWILSSLTSHLQSGTDLCCSDWEISPKPLHFQHIHLGVALNSFHQWFAQSSLSSSLDSVPQFTMATTARAFYQNSMKLIMLEVHKPWFKDLKSSKNSESFEFKKNKIQYII